MNYHWNSVEWNTIFTITIRTKVPTKRRTSIRMIIIPHNIAIYHDWLWFTNMANAYRRTKWLHNPDHMLKMLYMALSTQCLYVTLQNLGNFFLLVATVLMQCISRHTHYIMFRGLRNLSKVYCSYPPVEVLGDCVWCYYMIIRICKS